MKELGFEKNGDDEYYQRDIKWYIDKDMVKYFGEEIEVFNHFDHPQYDYYLVDGDNTWLFHSSWFEQPEFFKKEEFEI